MFEHSNRHLYICEADKSDEGRIDEDRLMESCRLNAGKSPNEMNKEDALVVEAYTRGKDNIARVIYLYLTEVSDPPFNPSNGRSSKGFEVSGFYEYEKTGLTGARRAGSLNLRPTYPTDLLSEEITGRFTGWLYVNNFSGDIVIAFDRP